MQKITKTDILNTFNGEHIKMCSSVLSIQDVLNALSFPFKSS